jgi:predicted Rossmann fold nucleotide-binding protein DprA/Smf involved in DNA uptake
MITRYQKSLVKGDPNKIKIAIIGSRIYENKRKIKDTIFKLKQMFGDKLEIVSGGASSGADKYAKKYSLELNVDYKEFNPAFTNKNLYSVMPESYYGKQFHVSQLFARNELVAKYCDRMIAFIHSASTTSGSDHAVKMAIKHKKPVVIINEL